MAESLATGYAVAYTNPLNLLVPFNSVTAP